MMRVKSLICRFLGPRISESQTIDSLMNHGNDLPATPKELRFQKIEFVRIKPEVPAWGGRAAIILAFRYRDGGGGYEYLDNGRTVGYDVLIQGQDDPKKFTRLAKAFADFEVEELEQSIAKEISSYIEAKTLEMLALGNPLTHELDLMHMPLNLQTA